MLAALIAVLFSVSPLFCQPVISARNLSLGSGGAAYLTGAEANFYNPANLMIYDREGRIHVQAGNAGFFFDPVLSTNQPAKQLRNFFNSFDPYTDGSQSISQTERLEIVSENYSSSQLLSQHRSRADIMWGGVLWQSNGASYSIAARSRIGTRTVTGRGWYSTQFIGDIQEQFRDFTLIKQQQLLHELSFGYAREFQFINGLLPRVGKLYIGIAPKIVAGGAFQDANYKGQYVISPENNETVYEYRMDYRASGNYSQLSRQYIATLNLPQSIARNLDRRFYHKPTGYGFGIDFGLSYVIPLGSDVSILEENGRNPLKKSLRFAFSITNLGLVSYRESPLSVTKPQQQTVIADQPPSSSKFTGSAGQFLAFFDQSDVIPNPFSTVSDPDGKPFSALLPTSLNAGSMLDLERFKLMGDLTLGLNNTAFTDTKLAVHLGMELRPLANVPLRFGTKLAAGLPVQFGFGTAIETRYWDLTLSSQLLMKSTTFTTEIIGGAVAGLQFHL